MKKFALLCIALISVPFLGVNPNLDHCLNVGRITCVKDVTNPDYSMSTGSVVPIYTQKAQDSYIVTFVTAKHVIEDVILEKVEIFSDLDKDLKVHLKPTIKVLDLEVVAIHDEFDVAVIRGTSLEYIKPVSISNTSLKTFDELYTIGCPVGYPPIITKGILSGRSERSYKGEMVATCFPVTIRS